MESFFFFNAFNTIKKTGTDYSIPVKHKFYLFIALIVCLDPSFIFRTTKYIPEFRSPK